MFFMEQSFFQKEGCSANTKSAVLVSKSFGFLSSKSSGSLFSVVPNAFVAAGIAVSVPPDRDMALQTSIKENIQNETKKKEGNERDTKTQDCLSFALKSQHHTYTMATIMTNIPIIPKTMCLRFLKCFSKKARGR